MRVDEIVKNWLIANGYNGLCMPRYECGCSMYDIMPCDEPCPGCVAAYKGHDGLMYPTKKLEDQ